jgi:acyl-CoA thioesterase
MNPEYAFDLDTHVSPDTEGRAKAHISARWSIGNAPNGGYLAALMARAMRETLRQQDPFSLTLHFLRPAQPGVANLEIEIVREGRGLSTCMSRLVQDGTERVRALGTFGDLGSLPLVAVREVAPPALPPPDRCVSGRPGPTSNISLAERVDMRLAPGAVSWLAGAKSNTASLSGWVRFADGRPFDALSLLLFADAFPPPVLNLEAADASWVPSIELTVHVRRRPKPGAWLRGQFTTHALIGDYLDEEGALWDDDGHVVAMSRQLARLHHG